MCQCDRSDFLTGNFNQMFSSTFCAFRMNDDLMKFSLLLSTEKSGKFVCFFPSTFKSIQGLACGN